MLLYNSSGLGADIENVVDGLVFALKKHRPVQIGRERWHYADAGVKVQKGNSSIACPRRNMFCYFLELSRCEPGKSWEGTWLEEPLKGDPAYIWLQEYAARPQTWLRKRVHDFVRKQQDEYFQGDCAVMHVRRGDVVFHEEQSRKYHAISEYLQVADKLNVTVHKNILLLSDDSNAFQEAKKNFPQHNWMQIDRPRKEAKEARWEQHLASNDPVYEMVVIQSIFKMVKQCDQLLYSTSNFAEHLRWSMEASGRKVIKMNIDEGKESHEVYDKSHVSTRSVSRHYFTG